MGTTDARLKWGSTHVIPVPRPIEDGGTLGLPFTIQASADGTNWGNPDAIVTAVQSRLQDGSLAIVDSFGNREAPIFLRVVSDSYDGLALGEAALVAESRVQGYNTLEWTPSEAFAVPTIFDVVYGLLTFDFDDYTETQIKRRFVARLTCLPFPRSATEVIARAVNTGETVVPTTTTISTGSSATGWSATFRPDGAAAASTPVTVNSGSVQMTPAVAGPGVATMTITGMVDVSTEKYVVIDWRPTGDPLDLLMLQANAASDGSVGAGTLISTSPAPRAGYQRCVFRIQAATTSLDGLRFQWGRPGGNSGLLVDQVFTTDVAPGLGNGRQLARTLAVAGAVRTQGRLTIEHESNPLGEVLCYVYRSTVESSAYVPSLRPHLTTSEASTANDTTVSGYQTSFDTDAVFDIPASALVAGNHRLMLSLFCLNSSTGFNTPITVVVETVIGGKVIPGSQTYVETVWVGPTGTGVTIVDVCGITLPATAIANTSGATIRIRAHGSDLDGAGAYHGIFFDDGWVFNLDIGTLSHVDCGGSEPDAGTPDGPSVNPAPGGPSKRLWFEPATVTNDGQDAIFRGHSADRSDAFSPADGIKGWTPPVFEPGEVTVFTVTTKAENAAVSLAYFPRFLHNAYFIAVDENGELVLEAA